MQYCSLQHQTFTFTTKHIHSWALSSLWLSLLIVFGALSSLFPSSFVQQHIGHLPTWGVHLSVSYLLAFSYCSQGFKARILKWLPFPSPVDHVLSGPDQQGCAFQLLHHSQMACLAHWLSHCLIECVNLHWPFSVSQRTTQGPRQRPCWSHREGIWRRLEPMLEDAQEQRAKANSSVNRTHQSQQIPSSNNARDDSTHVHHQMINTKIRLIIFFTAKDGEALNTQQKQDLELAVAHIISSLLQNLGSN